MADEKTPEWKTIVDAKAKKMAEITDRLRAARLARDAAAPPPEPKKRRPAAKSVTRHS
jgi:hypothetical protein